MQEFPVPILFIVLVATSLMFDPAAALGGSGGGGRGGSGSGGSSRGGGSRGASRGTTPYIGGGIVGGEGGGRHHKSSAVPGIKGSFHAWSSVLILGHLAYVLYVEGGLPIHA